MTEPSRDQTQDSVLMPATVGGNGTTSKSTGKGLGELAAVGQIHEVVKIANVKGSRRENCIFENGLKEVANNVAHGQIEMLSRRK